MPKRVVGVVLAGDHTLRAPVVIAADGRHSTLAFQLGLARHPARPRRWAIGGYFDQVSSGPAPPHYGEMHIRRGRYIGLAPVPGGLTNVCLVRSREAPLASGSPDRGTRDPERSLWDALRRDGSLRDRFANARLVTRPVVLGPLAVDVRDHDVDGLLLAGDAAGFIDPMTGDGLRFAVRGGELAADAALQALAHGWGGVHRGLRRDRRQEFAAKWRFNRTLRALVTSPNAVRVGELAAALAPSLLRTVVCHAGDCPRSEEIRSITQAMTR
jgi:flavin-dependent dehydrogenase